MLRIRIVKMMEVVVKIITISNSYNNNRHNNRYNSLNNFNIIWGKCMILVLHYMNYTYGDD